MLFRSTAARGRRLWNSPGSRLTRESLATTRSFRESRDAEAEASVSFADMDAGREPSDLEHLLARVGRIRRGNLGDCKPVGGGVSELRVDYGPGYRVYFGQQGQTLVVLLCGGDKRTQDRDIRQAKHYWRNYQQMEAGEL